MTILEVVRPIIHRAYGKSEFTDALAERLAGRISAVPRVIRDLERGEREALVRGICWDWMSGGNTAAAVAREIEAALLAQGF